MLSARYEISRDAILGEKQVICTYEGHHRVVCPIILGNTGCEEKVLTYQFGGTSGRGLAPGGDWRCMHLSTVRDARLRDGPRHEGSGQHRKEQTCVVDVGLDINIHVRKLRAP